MSHSKMSTAKISQQGEMNLNPEVAKCIKDIQSKAANIMLSYEHFVNSCMRKENEANEDFNIKSNLMRDRSGDTEKHRRVATTNNFRTQMSNLLGEVSELERKNPGNSDIQALREELNTNKENIVRPLLKVERLALQQAEVDKIRQSSEKPELKQPASPRKF